MRRVVDTNYLNQDEFREYLAASRKNVAVLTPYAELEMLKVEKQEEFLDLTEIMARPPRRSGSKCRRPCSRAPTR
jgi:hypothetical protein